MHRKKIWTGNVKIRVVYLKWINIKLYNQKGEKVKGKHFKWINMCERYVRINIENTREVSTYIP